MEKQKEMCYLALLYQDFWSKWYLNKNMKALKQLSSYVKVKTQLVKCGTKQRSEDFWVLFFTYTAMTVEIIRCL